MKKNNTPPQKKIIKKTSYVYSDEFYYICWHYMLPGGGVGQVSQVPGQFFATWSLVLQYCFQCLQLLSLSGQSNGFGGGVGGVGTVTAEIKNMNISEKTKVKHVCFNILFLIYVY